MDPNELVERIKQGDVNVDALLVSILAPRLMGASLAVGPEIPIADREDIVVAALELAIDKIDQFDPEVASFEAWARGFVRSGVRRWRRRRPLGANIPFDESLPARLEEADEQPDETKSVSWAVTMVLLNMSERDQEMYRLRYVEQLSHEAIAKTLRVTTVITRKRLQRMSERFKAQAILDPTLVEFLERKGEEG